MKSRDHISIFAEQIRAGLFYTDHKCFEIYRDNGHEVCRTGRAGISKHDTGIKRNFFFNELYSISCCFVLEL